MGERIRPRSKHTLLFRRDRSRFDRSGGGCEHVSSLFSFERQAGAIWCGACGRDVGVPSFSNPSNRAKALKSTAPASISFGLLLFASQLSHRPNHLLGLGSVAASKITYSFASCTCAPANPSPSPPRAKHRESNPSYLPSPRRKYPSTYIESSKVDNRIVQRHGHHAFCCRRAAQPLEQQQQQRAARAAERRERATVDKVALRRGDGHRLGHLGCAGEPVVLDGGGRQVRELRCAAGPAAAALHPAVPDADLLVAGHGPVPRRVGLVLPAVVPDERARVRLLDAAPAADQPVDADGALGPLRRRAPQVRPQPQPDRAAARALDRRRPDAHDAPPEPEGRRRGRADRHAHAAPRRRRECEHSGNDHGRHGRVLRDEHPHSEQQERPPRRARRAHHHRRTRRGAAARLAARGVGGEQGRRQEAPQAAPQGQDEVPRRRRHQPEGGRGMGRGGGPRGEQASAGGER